MGGESPAAATVLVVDDARIPRMALAKGVEREGHSVRQAVDGQDALGVLRREAIDMVLLDLVMPEVDGFQVLAEMRGDPQLRDIPVLVVSAIEEIHDVARAIEMGAIDCLTKPVEPALLRVRLRTALEQTRLRRLEQSYLRQELALRQQERLATLGRLSAGLGHELNNPAAAALSTARQLRQALAAWDDMLPSILARPDAQKIVTAATALLSHAIREPQDAQTAADRDERSEAIDEVLARLDTPDAWSWAAELADLGMSPQAVDAELSGLGDGVELALGWLRARSAAARAVGLISSSVERMAQLTAALRGYSHLDRAPQQDVDVRRGLEDTLTILAHKVPAGVRVVREYAPDLPVLHAFGGQLNQVWTNLIDNAIDAVGEHGTVTVRAQPDGRGVRVEVADDGPGIASDLVDRVFDPFVTTKPPGQGTGLGLHISHQIVTEAHAGQMTVRTARGHTVFQVRLPVMAPAGAVDDP